MSQNQNYLALVNQFGLDINALKQGQTLKITVMVSSLADFKALFAGNLSAHSRTLTHGQLQANAAAFQDDSHAHLLHRLTSYVYGDHLLSPADQQRAAAYFPLEVDVESAEDVTIDSAVQYGPSGKPVLLNYRKLTFSGNGSITAINTVLSLNAEIVEIVSSSASSGSEPYHIASIGKEGDSGAAGSNGSSVTNQAANGSNKQPASPGVCTGVGSGGDGVQGANGGDANAGEFGLDGKPNLQANITISQDIIGTLVVFTQSGGGGTGGKGGSGGTGQKGGDGGHGCDSGCEGTDGGNGGNGGNGGHGGAGGDGGNGVNGNNVYVTVPIGKTSQVYHFSQTSVPGFGGSGGAGGSGGERGGAGSGGKHSSNGREGANGTPGNAGAPGKGGTINGSPGSIYVVAG